MTPVAADTGLRRTLYLFGGGIIAVIGGVAALLILTTASRLVHQQGDTQLATYVSRTARMVETSAGERRHEMELLALMPLTEDLASTGKAAKGVDPVQALLRLRVRTSFRDLYVYSRDGTLVASTAPGDSGAARGPWFREALLKGTTIGVPYPSNGALVVDVATPIRPESGRGVVGVLRGILPLEALARPLRRDLRVDSLTQIQVVDQAGSVVITSIPGARVGQHFADDSLLGEADLRLTRIRGASGSERVALVGLASPRWTVVARQPAAAGLLALGANWGELTTKALAFILLALVLLAWLATWIDRKVLAPLKVAAGVASRVALGDLHRATELDDRGTDEVSRLGRAIKTMVTGLRELVGSIRTSAGESVDIATSISAAAEEMSAATIEVAGTSNDMTQRATAQAELVRDTQASAERIRAIAEQLANGARQAAERNATVARMAQEGRALLTTSATDLAALAEEVRLGTEEADALAEASAQIQQFVAQAKAVSTQTHMLALNAGIEAARAGEHGRGFAVVADEVRKLARQAEASATNTTRTVQAVLTRVEGTRKRLARLAQGGEDARTAAQRSASEMELLAAQAEESDAWTRQISGSAGDVHELVESMSERMRGITASTEEFAAAAEQISASTEQLSASTQEIAATAQLLSGAADRLSQAVKVFDLDGGESPTGER